MGWNLHLFAASLPHFGVLRIVLCGTNFDYWQRYSLRLQSVTAEASNASDPESFTQDWTTALTGQNF
jgi:hypothetical protein